jgi:hypothetical protein
MENLDHRALAAASFNACWELLETNDRSADDDVALLTNAFTSRYHWNQIGIAQNCIIADWMVSRAAAATGYGTLSVNFALRAVEASKDPSSADWMVASCAEGLARAYDAVGEIELRNEWCQHAERLVAAISDDEDRSIIAEQLADLLRA